jgi:hypothetical protein
MGVARWFPLERIYNTSSKFIKLISPNSISLLNVLYAQKQQEERDSTFTKSCRRNSNAIN